MDGLVTSLNKLRELSSDLYHKYVPIIDDSTDISKFAEPILTVPEVYNEFCDSLVNRIVYTQFQIKSFRNPLVVLEGDRIPLGYAGQEIYINPQKGRSYNAADFAGLLISYESDVKVQYMAINSDVQYPVTFSRQQLKKAFVSWGDLESFIDGLSNALYNGAYIDEFRFTKLIVTDAYKDNKAQIISNLSAVSDGDTGKAFVEKCRELFLNFQLPSTQYNAWSKVGGEGKPVTTWTNPEDIVILVRSDIRAKLDVLVESMAYNIDKSTLLGNIITIDNFDAYDDDGTKIFDGSAILGGIFDKSWFRIKRQDMFMDSFYNPNNRSIQYYLNVIKMYNYSLFANGVILATAAPTSPITALSFKETAPEVTASKKITLHLDATPAYGNTTVTFTSGTTSKATVTKVDDRTVEVTGVAAGTSVITATAGSVTATVTVTVNAAS
jgi:hypothetical protein